MTEETAVEITIKIDPAVIRFVDLICEGDQVKRSDVFSLGAVAVVRSVLDVKESLKKDNVYE